MIRRELLASKKAPWNRHFWPHKCHTPVECDTWRSGLFLAIMLARDSPSQKDAG
jgi:hypothetical protein